MEYLALIGDLIDSRHIGERSEFQKKLKQTLDEVSIKYKEYIASRFTLTLGDEFQGLLKDPSRVTEIILFIRLRINPVKVRFGLGAGEIATEINPNESIGADGPAYHRARKALEEIKRMENSKGFSGENTQVSADWPEPFLNILNSGFNLMHSLEKEWTEKQAENIFLFHFSGLTQTEIAEKKEVNQSTVNRSLSSSGAMEYLKAVRSSDEFISYIMKGGGRK